MCVNGVPHQIGNRSSKRIANWLRMIAQLGIGIVHFLTISRWASHSNLRAASGDGNAARFFNSRRILSRPNRFSNAMSHRLLGRSNYPVALTYSLTSRAVPIFLLNTYIELVVYAEYEYHILRILLRWHGSITILDDYLRTLDQILTFAGRFDNLLEFHLCNIREL